jgi:phosphoribosylglycinamide formyltransferase-1
MAARIAVLASGRGSNLRALIEYFDAPGEERGGEIVLALSNRDGAPALAVAREAGIAAESIQGRHADAEHVEARLQAHAVDLIVLAGYLRLLPAPVVAARRGRMVNVHPALLPAFGGKGMYGLHVHRAVLAAGARVSGATVQFVDERYDGGAIIAQWPVPVYDDDTADTLAARVLRVEHHLLPRVVDAVARGQVRLDAAGRAVGLLRAGGVEQSFALLPLPDEPLGRTLDVALVH